MAELSVVILAAGRASRFREHSGLATKLIADVGGTPMVRRVALNALGSIAGQVVVVTGHARVEVEAALQGLPVTLVHNDSFASGMASSLQVGLAVLEADCVAALIMLGDMPGVTTTTCNEVFRAYQAAPNHPTAAAPFVHGEIGNPVLLSRSLFAAVAQLGGDQGARRLLPNPGEGLVVVPVADEGVLADVDTPDALERLRQSIR